jgi:acyl-CoA thioesterase I
MVDALGLAGRFMRNCRSSLGRLRAAALFALLFLGCTGYTSDPSARDTIDSGVQDTSDSGVQDTSDSGVQDTSDSGVQDTSDSGVQDTSDSGVQCAADGGSCVLVPAPMPVISWGSPAYASSGTASLANGSNQATEWDNSGGYPSWLAYDLSSVPSAKRQMVWVSWWNQESFAYDSGLFGPSYSVPGSYTIEVNAADGGGSPPTSGWTVLATVTANVLHCRSHLLNMNGANWIRFNASAGASTNAAGANGCSLAMDVHDASQGIDAWNFVGDSIMALFAQHSVSPQSLPAGYSSLNFGKNIASKYPAYNPAWENNGLPYLTTSNYPLSTYLSQELWPGKYIAIQLGANNTPTDTATFYNDMLGLVSQLLAAGKTVFIATPSWQSVSMGHHDMSKLAAQVPLIVQHFAGQPVYAGPDMFAFFSQPANQGYITGNDGLHPDAQGQALMRDLWALTTESVLYGK